MFFAVFAAEAARFLLVDAARLLLADGAFFEVVVFLVAVVAELTVTGINGWIDFDWQSGTPGIFGA